MAMIDKRMGRSDDARRSADMRQGAPRRKLRIALYSHDTMGFGHIRRNLLIAQSLVDSSLQPTILLIAGAREACAFTMPPSVDCLTLPSLEKDEDGHYQSRHLDLSLYDLIDLRSKAIRATIESFAPDVLIVDKAPRGASCELDPTLQFLRAGGRTHCVLGLRDVLDDPATVKREWKRERSDEVIRKFYEMVWVYGDPAVYDSAHECHFSTGVGAKVHYTGYLDQRMRLDLPEPNRGEQSSDLGLPPGRLILCGVGGGQDGARLAEAFCEASLPEGMSGVLLTGPYMPKEVRLRLHQRAAERPRMRVLDFFAEPAYLMRRAERVIAMGGYNTICEVLSFNCPALIVPRVKPRLEQLIRAERLQELGVLEMLHPDDLSPAALTAWLARAPRRTDASRSLVSLDGLALLPRLVQQLVSPTRSAASGRQTFEEQRNYVAR
jgi:predicted glycosyltransferase